MFLNFGDNIINMDFVTNIKRYDAINLEKKDPYSILVEGFHISVHKHFRTEKDRNDVYHEIRNILNVTKLNCMLMYEQKKELNL